MKHQKGFTLIELLVVVTIIVVLLALLVPALDKAIYQAELVACAARLKAQSNAVLTYALDHRRAYPYRPAMVSYSTPWRAEWLAYTAQPNPADDDRPPLRPYLSIDKTLACPFVTELDFDTAPRPGNIVPGVLLVASYQRFYGFRYYGEEGMMRLGNRMGWTEGANGPTDWFNVLAADLDLAVYESSYSIASHPDSDGFFALITVDNGFWPPNRVYESYSYWGRFSATPNRGSLDRNFAFDDNSVRTIADLKLDDPRLTRIGGHSFSQDSATYSTWLPKN